MFVILVDKNGAESLHTASTNEELNEMIDKSSAAFLVRKAKGGVLMTRPIGNECPSENKYDNGGYDHINLTKYFNVIFKDEHGRTMKSDITPENLEYFKEKCDVVYSDSSISIDLTPKEIQKYWS